MSTADFQILETTAGQVADALSRLGVPAGRVLTIVIEPENWLTKARQESRRQVIAFHLNDDQLELILSEAHEDVQKLL